MRTLWLCSQRARPDGAGHGAGYSCRASQPLRPSTRATPASTSVRPGGYSLHRSQWISSTSWVVKCELLGLSLAGGPATASALGPKHHLAPSMTSLTVVAVHGIHSSIASSI